jgi:hypothetical protein
VKKLFWFSVMFNGIAAALTNLTMLWWPGTLFGIVGMWYAAQGKHEAEAVKVSWDTDLSQIMREFGPVAFLTAICGFSALVASIVRMVGYLRVDAPGLLLFVPGLFSFISFLFIVDARDNLPGRKDAAARKYLFELASRSNAGDAAKLKEICDDRPLP